MRERLTDKTRLTTGSLRSMHNYNGEVGEGSIVYRIPDSWLRSMSSYNAAETIKRLTQWLYIKITSKRQKERGEGRGG